MRHFAFLDEEERAALFAVPPRDFDRTAPTAEIATALGATLYSPGSRTSLCRDALRAAHIGATSQVWCLEDSITHDEVPVAQANVVSGLKDLDTGQQGPAPLLFIRVRTPQQIGEIADAAGPALRQLTGFVLPKITPGDVAVSYLSELATASTAIGQQLFALPVLEHQDLAWRESRRRHLDGLRELFDAHRDQVLSLRVGGTDLCGLFGLRRDRDTTIWDVAVVREALCEVMNVFGRRGDYTISGPVWEHFGGPDRLFKPQLRETPFETVGQVRLRQQLLRDDADELLREVLLDRANGFLGKTVIHPTHVAMVNVLHAVSQEEHDDATTVLAARGRGGSLRSTANNKMNEAGPHELWAEQLLARAAAYGVLAGPGAVVELLQRGRLVADAVFPRGDLVS